MQAALFAKARMTLRHFAVRLNALSRLMAQPQNCSVFLMVGRLDNSVAMTKMGLTRYLELEEGADPFPSSPSTQACLDFFHRRAGKYVS